MPPIRTPGGSGCAARSTWPTGHRGAGRCGPSPRPRTSTAMPAVNLDLLGTALFEVGESQAAEGVLRAGRRRFPDDVWLNYDLARFLEARSRDEEAIRYYSVARALRPETALPLATLLADRGESDEAIAVFEDLLRRRPDDGRNWACYGRLLQERGDRAGSAAALEKGVAILREAIRLRPDDANAHSDLGFALDYPGEAGGGGRCSSHRRPPPARRRLSTTSTSA